MDRPSATRHVIVTTDYEIAVNIQTVFLHGRPIGSVPVCAVVYYDLVLMFPGGDERDAPMTVLDQVLQGLADATFVVYGHCRTVRPSPGKDNRISLSDESLKIAQPCRLKWRHCNQSVGVPGANGQEVSIVRGDRPRRTGIPGEAQRRAHATGQQQVASQISRGRSNTTI